MGTSITITGVEPMTVERLHAEARRRGVDVSAVARDALRRGLPPPAVPPGLANADADGRYHDLDHLIGTWSEADAEAFVRAVADFSRVDPDLWK